MYIARGFVSMSFGFKLQRTERDCEWIYARGNHERIGNLIKHRHADRQGHVVVWQETVKLRDEIE